MSPFTNPVPVGHDEGQSLDWSAIVVQSLAAAGVHADVTDRQRLARTLQRLAPTAMPAQRVEHANTDEDAAAAFAQLLDGLARV